MATIGASTSGSCPDAARLICPENSSVFKEAHQARVKEEVAASKPPFINRAAETNGVAIDVISAARNSLTAASLAEKVGRFAGIGGTIASGLGILGGFLGIFTGANIVRREIGNLQRDTRLGSLEGGLCHGAWGILGIAYGVFSGGLIVSNAATLAHVAGAAAIGGQIVIPAAFILYGSLGIRSGYGLAVNGLFRSQLNQALKEGKSESLHKGLKWLYEQVHGGKSDAELQKKWDRFAFRTSEACCRFVREKVTDEFLQKVQSGDAQAISEAKFLIQEVKRENAKQLLKHTICMVIAVLGIATMICALLFAGPIAPALFALGAGFWLLVDSSFIHEKLGNLFFGKSLTPPPSIDPSRAKLLA